MPPALETHLHAQAEDGRRFFWHRLRWHALRGWLPRQQPFTLVDVGAGAGFLHDYLRADFPLARYRFVEPLPGLRQALRERAGAGADWAERDDYREAQYAALLDVLEHQVDDAAFLTDLAHKLAPGALLLLTVPALPVLWSGWDVGLGHQRRYTRRSLAATVARAPFALRRLEYLFPEMLPLALYRRLRSGAHPPPAAGLEFPRLPALLNEALYAAGRVSLALRGAHPAGTSLLAVLQRQ
jgi:SAM-dependent methyltransferase